MTSSNQSRVLVLANHDNQHLDPLTARLITAAQNFGLPVDVLVAGSDCHAVAGQAAALRTVERVLLSDHEELVTSQVENLAALLTPRLQGEHDILLAATNTLGRELIPRLAAILDTSPLSDVTRIIEPDLFERPIHAGAALVQIRMQEAKKLMTVRAGRFEPMASRKDGEPPAELVMLDKALASRRGLLIGEEFFWDQPALEDAPVVIGIGRGAHNEENFAFIEKIAAKWGAVIGGTRIAVETGMVPNNVQIGQTGKTIAPRLYLALGISGAAQHLAGISDAHVIVAINKDPEAPIFSTADYGVVGNLQTVLPALQKALTNER